MEQSVSEERLIDIETRLAHQDQALHELNEVVTEQQASIMKLEALCATLLERMVALGESQPSAPGDERPPHY